MKTKSVLPGQVVLVLQGGGALGAYQGIYRFYVADTAGRPVRARPLDFRDFVDAGGGSAGIERLRGQRTEEIIGLPTFDAARRELAVERKFRGPGDCGLRLLYAITDSGTALREVRGKLACDGKGPYDAARWPVMPSASTSQNEQQANAPSPPAIPSSPV